MSERKPQINLVVTEEQKDRWESYLDSQSGFKSMSQLIRQSVEKQVQADSDGQGSESSERVTEGISEVLEAVKRVESKVVDLEGRVATVETEVRDDPKVKHLANEVFGVLPSREEVLETAKLEAKAGASPNSPASRGTVEGIATELEVEQYRIPDALEKLQEDTHQIGTLVLSEDIQGWSQQYGEDHRTRYYKQR
jgi:hypothetical protein